jgi:23S rRNA (uracil1939-C5)-methyltransferase
MQSHPTGLRLGDKLSLEITGLNSVGQGVARHGEGEKSLAVFVPLACPGDEVRAEVSEIRREFAVARLTELRKPSPDRAQPVCPAFGNCGGCQLQHIQYAKQLELKTTMVRDALVRIGKLEDPHVLPTLGMAEPWGFRNKAQFPVGDRRGRLVAGFYAQGSHRLVPIDSCPVQHPTNNRILAEAVKAAGRYDLRPYDERTGEGFLRHILGKVAAETGQSLVALVTNARAFPAERDVARELVNRVPGLAGVVQNVNTARTNVILGQVTRPLLGEPVIEDRIGPLRFKVSTESFLQTNPAQAKVVYDRVLEYADVTAADDAIDAYCGIGTITLLLARKARKVYGIENVEAAVNDAKQNAKLNRIDNVEFLLGDAEKVLPDLARRGVRPTVLVLDPPRKGADNEVIKAALAMGPARIVYVSCDPSSMARDIGKLVADGAYALVEAQPVDMFPHTAHVETAALVTRVEK